MRKLMFVLMAVVCLGMMGCAAHDAQINPLLNRISHVDQAIQTFGPPMQTSDLHGGAKVYVWSTSRDVQIGGFPVYQPNNQTHTGTIYSPSGGAYTYSGQSYGNGSVSYTPAYNVNFACNLQMIVEQSGSIRTWSYQGNACDSLIINASLPYEQPNFLENVDSEYKTAPGDRPGLNDCLKQSARNYSGQGLDFEAISAEIERECEQKTGGRIPNLAKYYVREAQEKN